MPNSAEAVVFLGSLANGEFNLDELRDSIKRTFAGTCNLTTYVVNLKYFITATIYDLHGNLIFLVQDNKWQIFKNSIRKYNYDDNGFEVFDKDGRIAMSIDFRTFRIAPALYVKGIIPCTSSSLTYYSPEDFFLNVAYGTRELNRAFDNLYNSYPIQPLFRYTGNDWQHARL
ncbi:MAG TPA: hypothetical protein VL832_06800 [Puia sp.]|nr:hypothetical protein [Puia sp.]